MLLRQLAMGPSDDRSTGKPATSLNGICYNE
jgi:hypothetical protein